MTEKCAGCPGGNIDVSKVGEDVDTEQVNEIMSSLSETKESMDEMMNSLSGLQFDMESFSSIENQIKEVSDYLTSGEFFKNINDTIKQYAHAKPQAMQGVSQYYSNEKNTDELDRAIAMLNEIKVMQSKQNETGS